MTFYRTIINRAWKNTWQHKYLWFFGLFAALLGNGGELELVFRGLSEPDGNGIYNGFNSILETGIFQHTTLNNIAYLAQKEPFSLFLALFTLFIIAVVAIFLLWLTIVSQVAIVHNTAKEKHDKEHDFKDGLMTGIKKFWPVFGLNIISRLIISAFFLFIGIIFVSTLVRGGGLVDLLWYVLLFVVFIPLSLAFSFIIKYAIAFVVIKGQKTFQAVKSGWRLFKQNWLVSIEMAIVLFFINFLVGLGLILLLLILAVPFLFLLMMFVEMSLLFNFWLIAIATLIIFLILVVFAGAILSTFQISSWTYLFMELVSKGGVSKIVRIFNKKNDKKA